VVWAEVAADIGRRPMSALVSDQPGEAQRTDILGEIRARCAQRTEASFGIELVDVRLKRISLPEQNKQSVFRRMRAERDRIARKYRAEGEEEAMKIKAAADRERSQLLAEAERDAALRRGAAAKEAIRIYAVAHGKDPEFYRFLRSLEAYRAILDRDTTLVLSSDSALFRYLSDPAPAGSAGTTSATAESATPGR